MKRFFQAAKPVFFFVMLGAMFFPLRTNAQSQAAMSANAPEAKEADPNDGWHFGATAYIWFAGINGEVGALGHEASVHADFGDIFSYLNMGAMGIFDARYKRVIIPIDFLWLKLSDHRSLPVNDVADSVKAQMTETVLTPKIGYRIADGKRVKVDALFGIRYWHISTDLTLQPVQVAGGFSQSGDWTDAVAGGRITMALTPKVSAIIGGDAGGASARSDYQVAGILGYKLSRKWDLLVGYRYLHVNYRPNTGRQFVYDVNMPGLGLGATYTFK